MSAVFHLDRVSRTFRRGFWGRRSQAVEDVSLTVESGEAVGFIGHNGAGKSTTIRMMLGLLQPSSGTACIRGEPAREPAARRGIAYVPEVALVYDHLTPRELLDMSMALHQKSRGQRAQRIEFWLQRMGLAQAADKRVRGFSKGMTQRVALAMALCVEPEVLVLDEPLSGLDPLGRKEIVDVLEDFRRAGNTLFFSSHVLSDVERLADRFVFIHQGRIRAIHSVASILNAASDRYELTFYSERELPGHVQTGRGLWSRDLPVAEIGTAIADITASGGVLYGIKSAASLEQLYVRLVDTANSSRDSSPCEEAASNSGDDQAQQAK